MKNIIKLFGIIALLAVIICAMSACSAKNQKHDPETDFEAEVFNDGKSVRISGYLGNKWEIGIPPQINNLPVTIIGGEEVRTYSGNFRNKNIISIIFPDSVTSILEHRHGDTFEGNPLTSITIGSNVVISNRAFNNGFSEYYNNNGRIAGTYTRDDDYNWTRK